MSPQMRSLRTVPRAPMKTTAVDVPEVSAPRKMAFVDVPDAIASVMEAAEDAAEALERDLTEAWRADEKVTEATVGSQCRTRNLGTVLQLRNTMISPVQNCELLRAKKNFCGNNVQSVGERNFCTSRRIRTGKASAEFVCTPGRSSTWCLHRSPNAEL